MYYVTLLHQFLVKSYSTFLCLVHFPSFVATAVSPVQENEKINCIVMLPTLNSRIYQEGSELV